MPAYDKAEYFETTRLSYPLNLTVSGGLGGSWAMTADSSLYDDPSTMNMLVPYGYKWTMSGNMLKITDVNGSEEVSSRRVFNLPSATGYNYSVSYNPASGTKNETTQTITANVTRAVNKYQLTIQKNPGIASLYYKIGAGSYTVYSAPILIDYNASVSVYGVPATGYAQPLWNSSSPYTFNMPASAKTIDFIITELQKFNLIFTDDTTYTGRWTVDSSSSQGETTGVEVQYGDTWSISGNVVTVKRGQSTIWVARYTKPTQTGFYFTTTYSPSSGTVTAQHTITATNTRHANQYKLIQHPGEGVANITVNRTESPYAGASIGVVSNNGAIYYGDKLSVSASPSAGYQLDLYTNSYTVSGNVDVYV